MEETLAVTEIFYTLAGEGNKIGVPTVYVRVFGCNMNPICPWCDTLYSVKKIDDSIKKKPLSDIVKEVMKYNHKEVAFTGGEPMLYMNKIETLMFLLSEGGTRSFNFETNGIVYPSDEHQQTWFKEFHIDYNVSPKFHAIDLDGKSTDDYIHSLRRWSNKNIFEGNVNFKFVFEGPKTIEQIKKLEERIGGFNRAPIYLMPEGRGVNKELYQACAKACMDTGWNMSPRLQCIVWDDMRGK